jgi:hypothetical protein
MEEFTKRPRESAPVRVRRSVAYSPDPTGREVIVERDLALETLLVDIDVVTFGRVTLSLFEHLPTQAGIEIDIGRQDAVRLGMALIERSAAAGLRLRRR